MLIEGHIFTIKTKDATNVADIRAGGKDIIISGLNVLKDQIRLGDFVFVVFGGDKPKGWKPGLVGLAHIAKPPFYDGGKNFKVGIDVDVYFEPSIVRGELVTYPDTFDTIGIGPITKWEPNQAISSVSKRNAIGLIQAIWDMRPNYHVRLETLFGQDLWGIPKRVRRYFESFSELGTPDSCSKENVSDLRNEFKEWLNSDYLTSKGSPLGPSAINTYIVCLDSVNKPGKDLSSEQHSEQLWYNIYDYLYGTTTKDVFSIGSQTELESVYGGLRRVVDYTNEEIPVGVNEEHYEKIREWINSEKVKKSGWIKSSFNRYSDFLQWRETQNKGQAESLPACVNKLDIALKYFAEKRVDKGEDGWFAIGRAVNGRIRDYFAPLTREVLEGFGKAQIEELFLGQKDASGKIKFNPMWSGSNGTGWDHIKNAATADVVKALVQYKMDVGIASKFLTKGFEPRPNGFGPSVISELLMKFHPESCIKHGQKSHNALTWLGLIDFPWKPQFTTVEYSQVCGVTAKILGKMSAMKLSRQINADGSEDNEPPDYLTVNEFLYFVDTNLDSLQEEVMSKEFKAVSKASFEGKRQLSEAVANDEMLQRLMAALRTKPFVILAGHSGTGKSQLVRRLAYMTCNDNNLLAEKDVNNAPGNYCMVQVKPNWHDSTDLLGYYTEMNGGKYHTTQFVEFICKAYAYPETPFFVCLDEMNLAPVEQYFAEFLSALESYSDKTKRTDKLITENVPPEAICGATKLNESLNAIIASKGLTIPRNLFVIGTVNVDETTCQFSRKVLDRAMTLLMTAVSFETMTKINDPSEEQCLTPEGINYFLNRPAQMVLTGGQKEKLAEIQKQVGDSPFAIAYRFANEYALYQFAYQILMSKGLREDKTPNPDDDDSQKIALDHVVLMKLLPRIHGSRQEVEDLFGGQNENDSQGKGLINTLVSGQSVEMMRKILKRSGEYLSFWP